MKDVSTVCCKKCDPCSNCFDLGEYRLRDLLYAIDKEIADAAVAEVMKNEWGTSRGCKSDEDLDKLRSYRGVVQRYYKAVINQVEPTICPESAQKVIDKAKRLIHLSCIDNEYRIDQEVDNSKYAEYLLSNPMCPVFENWERVLYDTVFNIGIKSRNVKTCTEFTLKVKAVKEPMKVLKAVSTYTNCKINKLVVKADYEECKIQHKAVSKYHNCNLSLNAYSELIKCGFTYKAISDIHECGLSLTFNAEKNCPVLHYNADSSVELCDLDVNVFAEDVDCKLLSKFVGTDVCSDLDNQDIIEI